MIELIEGNWPLLVAALLIGVLVAWWIFVASRRTRVSRDRRDVLDDGADPAARNQALIDSAPAATVPHVSEPAPVVAATDAADTDDLTRIKGIGPKLAALLNSLGVVRFTQVADWSDADIDRIDAQLGRFEGRIRRDDWREQARLLAAGDQAAYEGKFGKL